RRGTCLGAPHEEGLHLRRQPVRLGLRRFCGDLLVADDAEEGVDPVEEVGGGAGGGGGEGRPVVLSEYGADAAVGGGEGLGRVEVVAHRREGVVVGLPERPGQAVLALATRRKRLLGHARGLLDALALLLRVLERLPREVERLAVAALEEREAEGQRVHGRAPVGPPARLRRRRQVADGEEVAEPLAHLLALDEQEAGVYPVAGEGLPGEGLRL